jgi:hypothetical protein
LQRVHFYSLLSQDTKDEDASMFVFLPSYVLIFFATRLQKNREGTKNAIQRTLAWKMITRSLLALPQLEIWASVVACDDNWLPR